MGDEKAANKGPDEPFQHLKFGAAAEAHKKKVDEEDQKKRQKRAAAGSNECYLWGQGQFRLTMFSLSPLAHRIRPLHFCAAFAPSCHLPSWGFSSTVCALGQLGHGDEDNYDMPRLVTMFSTTRTKQISLGNQHTLFVTGNGQIYSCGRANFGQLGHGTPHETINSAFWWQ